MPKQVLKIDKFHGGISNDAASTDIADNELEVLSNVKVNELGKISMLGDCGVNDDDFSSAVALTDHGRGFTMINTDFSLFEANASSADVGIGSGASSVGSHSYWLAETASGAEIVKVGTDSTNGQFTLGNNTTKQSAPEFYWMKGALRAYDSDFSVKGLPRWRGHIEGKLYGTDSGDNQKLGHVYNSGAEAAGDYNFSALDQWFSADARIMGCFEEQTIKVDSNKEITVGKNLIMGSKQVKNGMGSSGAQDHENDYGPLFAFANEKCGTGTNSGSAAGNITTNSGMYWGLGMYFKEGDNGSGTWCPNGDESYQFFCTTIYQDDQESLPQMFSMFPGGPQADSADHGPTTNGNDYANSYHSATPMPSVKFGVSSNWDASPNGTDSGIGITFSPVIKWYGAAYGDNGLDQGADTDGYRTYNFGASDNDLARDASQRDGGDPRINGVKCYYASSEDGFSTKYELWHWDFEKGFKAPESEGGGVGSFCLVDWTSVHNGSFTSAGSKKYHYQHPHAGPGGASGVYIKDPPTFRQYEIENGHSVDETIHVDGFKTSTYCNGRMYIGNVIVGGIKHGDKVIRSQVGQYDKFPFEVGDVTAVKSDGEEIIKLLSYADRILQFKQNTLYILNVTREDAFLEAEYKYKGIANTGQACETDYGCAWANETGCYIYDGKEVKNLLEKGGIQKIKASTWAAHIGDYTRVGYNPVDRQIVVTNGASDDGSAYVHDLTTEAWTLSSQVVTVGGKGPFINMPATGKLAKLHETNSAEKVHIWSDPSSGNKTIDIKTKNFDFGNPAVRKKIYKVYITYKYGHASLDVTYGKDGGTTNLQFDGGLTETTAGPHIAELKPNATINNVYTFQLQISGTAPYNVEIQDISIIYRIKNVK